MPDKDKPKEIHHPLPSEAMAPIAPLAKLQPELIKLHKQRALGTQKKPKYQQIDKPEAPGLRYHGLFIPNRRTKE